MEQKLNAIKRKNLNWQHSENSKMQSVTLKCEQILTAHCVSAGPFVAPMKVTGAHSLTQQSGRVPIVMNVKVVDSRYRFDGATAQLDGVSSGKSILVGVIGLTVANSLAAGELPR